MICVLMSMVDSPEEKRKIETLYEKYNGLMFAVTSKILSRKEDVEDVVFHAWERIIKNVDKIDEIDCNKTKSFIVIITERIAIDYYRKIQKESLILLDEYEESPYLFTIDKGIEEYETIDWLRSIPKKYSEALILFYINGLSTKEIAQMLGIKEGSVSARLSRGREMIKTHLK